MTRLVQTSSKTTVRVCSADPVWSGTSSPPRMKCSVHLSHLVSECTCPSRGLSPRETSTVLGREAGPDSSEGAGSAAPSSCQVQTHILHQGAWLQSSRETQGRFRICLEEIPEPQTVFGGPRIFLEPVLAGHPSWVLSICFCQDFRKSRALTKSTLVKLKKLRTWISNLLAFWKQIWKEIWETRKIDYPGAEGVGPGKKEEKNENKTSFLLWIFFSTFIFLMALDYWARWTYYWEIQPNF